MDRIKAHIKGLTISSIFVLLPVFIGIFLWNELPDKLPGHFGLNGQVDRYDPKWVIVFVWPLIMLLLHILCSVMTIMSSKQTLSDKVITALFLIFPVISNAAIYMSYASALNTSLSVNNISAIMIGFIGLLMVILGNYVPKVKPNHVMGVRIPTTYESKRNWNYTNRIGAWCFVADGIIVVLASLISFITGDSLLLLTVLVVTTMVASLVPIFASINYKNKHKDEAGYYDKVD
ncbi:MAG: DUF1648 domain-containing protein [Clostridia bacterium]|nr:DUF1648 domain-containing protein [Clostridia bacterium]